jgi:hypothetical protein
MGRHELAPPRPGDALTPSDASGEIFDVDLQPRPVGSELVQGQVVPSA